MEETCDEMQLNSDEISALLAYDFEKYCSTNDLLCLTSKSMSLYENQSLNTNARYDVYPNSPKFSF